MGLGVAGSVALGSAVLGAGTSIYGANKAAGSAKDAAGLQRQQYEQTRSDLQPFFNPAYNALQQGLVLAGSGPTGGGPDYVAQAANNIPLQMTQAQLEATPGYQFTRDQGLKATQSALAARSLGASGAALKGAAEYATGLANKTYLDQFNVAQQRFGDYLNLNTGQQGNIQGQFGRLNALATLGENAAAQTGTIGQSAASTAGNYVNQAGLASAAGLQGVNSALTGAANNYLAYDAYNRRTAAQPVAQMTGYTDPNTGFNNAPGDPNYRFA